MEDMWQGVIVLGNFSIMIIENMLGNLPPERKNLFWYRLCATTSAILGRNGVCENV